MKTFWNFARRRGSNALAVAAWLLLASCVRPDPRTAISTLGAYCSLSLTYAHLGIYIPPHLMNSRDRTQGPVNRVNVHNLLVVTTQFLIPRTCYALHGTLRNALEFSA